MPRVRHQDSDQRDRVPTLPEGRLTRKVALITGAGRGIGRATAELFAREGAAVVLCSKTTKELQAVVAAIKGDGGVAIGKRADISNEREAKALVRLAIRRFGHLDLLINNAGILGLRVPITDYPTREWRQVLEVNLTGTFFVTRETARVMSEQGSGCLITVSSSVGRIGRADWGAYAVSKFGVEGLTQVLADELRHRGIHVVALNPGGTRTRMRAAAYPDEDPGRLRDPSQTAQALLQLACSASPAVSGQSFDLETLP